MPLKHFALKRAEGKPPYYIYIPYIFIPAAALVFILIALVFHLRSDAAPLIFCVLLTIGFLIIYEYIYGELPDNKNDDSSSDNSGKFTGILLGVFVATLLNKGRK